MIRELERELSADRLSVYQAELDLFKQVPAQKRSDKNKVYSLHKPFTSCIVKGKTHKQYELGNKIRLTVTSKSLVITSIMSFKGNPHDSKTMEPLLNQIKSNDFILPKEVVYDRGGKRQKQIKST